MTQVIALEKPKLTPTGMKLAKKSIGKLHAKTRELVTERERGDRIPYGVSFPPRIEVADATDADSKVEGYSIGTHLIRAGQFALDIYELDVDPTSSQYVLGRHVSNVVPVHASSEYMNNRSGAEYSDAHQTTKQVLAQFIFRAIHNAFND